MTTVELIKKACAALDAAVLVDNNQYSIGRASVFLEFAEAQAKADAEALKDALTQVDLARMGHVTVMGMTDEEKAELIEKIKGCPVEVFKVGEPE